MVPGALIAENSEMKTKLKDQGSPPRYLKNEIKCFLILGRYKLLFLCGVMCMHFRSLSRGGISKPCASSDSVKGLEEMRAHYIKALSKIKCKY